jgi:membrane fusion protein, multidrug efflux system
VVNFVDRAVNPETNTLQVRARFPNPNGLLRPGGNVRVRVQLTEATNARLIPQRAVQQGQEGTSVYVVSADGTVERRTVETGARYGNLWVIDRGLDAGESVVVEGVQKIRPGVKVATTRAPAEEPTPAPPAGTQRGS